MDIKIEYYSLSEMAEEFGDLEEIEDDEIDYDEIERVNQKLCQDGLQTLF